MDNGELIQKIAHLRGISDHFVNFKDQKETIADHNIQLLVEAMGYAVHDAHSLAEQATELDTHQWRELLEPVTVINDLKGERNLSVYVESSERHHECHYLIECEQGELINTSIDLLSLPVTGEYWLNDHQYLRHAVPMKTDLPLGYHKVTLCVGERQHKASLIVTPSAAYEPKPMANGDKIWGTAIQLYTLRSATNWGIGDLTDLKELIERISKAGGDFVGLNPMHALFLTNPNHCSPYSPSNRAFLNPLYVDIEAVEEFKCSESLQKKVTTKAHQQLLNTLRATQDVHYTAVSELKQTYFKHLYAVFLDQHQGKNTNREQHFLAFVAHQGEALEQHVIFEALQKHFFDQDSSYWSWPAWPREYQQPTSDAVKQFAIENADALGFYRYLQFIAHEQLEAAHNLCNILGMRIGLYRDLAVGSDRGGAEVWVNQDSYCLNASIGAPPDDLGPNGQNWGLPPLDPVHLKNNKYHTSIMLLRNNMRSCGALRIDHALALLRLWWCPPNQSAAYGAYVYYDLFDLLGLLCLESHRQQCMVIAEDLGTVPDEINENFPKANLYSNKVFYFESDGEKCTPVESYPAKSLAIVCNHDMPTLNAFWQGSDLTLRHDLGLSSADILKQDQLQRRRMKAQIVALLSQYSPADAQLVSDESTSESATKQLIRSVHSVLASGSAQLLAIQLEDMMNMEKPVNIPGTSSEYPNWRRKLDLTTSELFDQQSNQSFCEAITSHRRNHLP